MVYRILANKAFTQSREGMQLLLSNNCKINAVVENLFDEQKLSELVCDCDAVIAGAEKWGKTAIGSATKLKIIARFGVGYDNIDIIEANSRGIYVTNTPWSISDSVAEHAIALMLCLTKNICRMHIGLQCGIWKKQIGSELRGKTIGFIGLGRIGKKIVEKLKGFQVKIVGYDTYQDDDFAESYGIKYLELNDLLKQSDIITIHCPLNESTRHLINIQNINMMKSTAHVINTSRGSIIDEQALLYALKNNKIAGAGLDVFESEPLFNNELQKLENVILTPHVASSTIEARNAMGIEAATAILQVFAGESPKNSIARE